MAVFVAWAIAGLVVAPRVLPRLGGRGRPRRELSEVIFSTTPFARLGSQAG